MAEPRFFVSDDVEHGCCYSATVRDRQDLHGPGSYGSRPSLVCECDDTKTAEIIAKLLNDAQIDKWYWWGDG